MRSFPLLVAASAAVASLAGAQTAAIRGTVREDTTSRTVANAEITLAGVGRKPARTNEHGEFLIGDLPRGTYLLRVKAPGYEALEANADLAGLDTLQIEIQLMPSSDHADVVAEANAEKGKAKTQRNVISRAEILTVLASASDGYDVVRQLRPAFLRSRGSSNMGDPGGMKAPAAGGDSTKVSSPQRMGSADPTAATRNAQPRLPKVSINEGPLLELEELRRIEARAIKEIRFVASIDAATRWGPGADTGVIVVLTK